jgi:type VI secretion system protein ImpJ
MLDTAGIAPEQLYRECSILAGALTAFSTRIGPQDLPVYTHQDLGACFFQLDKIIRLLLETVVPSNFIALPLRQVRDTIYAASIEKDAYFEGSRFYLGVSADLRDADLIARAPALLKCGSATEIETLIRNALPGLRLQHVPVPPKAIPVKLRYQYFAVEASGTVWQSVLRARNFAVYAPDELLNPQMELIVLLAKPV